LAFAAVVVVMNWSATIIVFMAVVVVAILCSLSEEGRVANQIAPYKLTPI